MIYESELYHHGILGMKWGKKNGPPYPLDGSDHSASEKKAGWEKSLGKSGSLSDKDKKKIEKHYTKSLKKGEKEVNKNASEANVRAKTNRDMSDLKNAESRTAREFGKYAEEQKSKNSSYVSSGDYARDFSQVYNKVYNENAENFVLAGIQGTSKNTIKARQLVERYDMTSWSDVAKANEDFVNELEKRVKKSL